LDRLQLVATCLVDQLPINAATGRRRTKALTGQRTPKIRTPKIRTAKFAGKLKQIVLQGGGLLPAIF
jgi:hypothetical protein